MEHNKPWPGTDVDKRGGEDRRRDGRWTPGSEDPTLETTGQTGRPPGTAGIRKYFFEQTG